MISVFDKKEECCGCTACKHICPTRAIEMESDQEGFLYPLIDQNLCIDCGRCKEVCAFQNGYDTLKNLKPPKVYAAKHKKENIRMSSTSGGVFTAISDHVLENSGVVFGVAFDENMNAVHRMAKTSDERDMFKGSKYVQSDLKNVYPEIKQLISKGVQVLFTGTPCQTAGLKRFLSNDNTGNLILCDIVCYGTPSPLLWREHIKHLEKKENCKIIDYYCRHKVKGWHAHNEMVIYKNGKEDYESILSQKHKNLFHSHNILRPACHNCKYTNLERPSDITIADFWGIEKHMPEFDDNKGVSLLLVNTSTGQKLLENIKQNLILKESNTQDCLQPQLNEPSKPSHDRSKFWKDYETRGYEYVVKKYAGYNMKNISKMKLRRVLDSMGLLTLIKRLRKAK